MTPTELMDHKWEVRELRAEIERLRAQCDTYGLALMMIREGAAGPRDVARVALNKFLGRGAVNAANINMLDGPDPEASASEQKSDT